MTFNLHFKAAHVPSQKLYLPRNVNLARLDCVPRTGCLAHASSSRTFAVRSYEVSAPRISEDCDFEFLIQCTTSSEDLIQAAWLRAEAYHEIRQYGRFTDSFVKQFAQREAHNLLQRVQSSSRSFGQQTHKTLVAVDSQKGKCVGTLDVRIASADQIQDFRGTLGESDWIFQSGSVAYLSNVAVAPFFRGKGVGSRLVIAAKDCAREYLGADWLFAHVDFDNQAAQKLYSKCDFFIVGEAAANEGSWRGHQFLLCSRC